jgi:hypothetical protein
MKHKELEAVKFCFSEALKQGCAEAPVGWLEFAKSWRL